MQSIGRMIGSDRRLRTRRGRPLRIERLEDRCVLDAQGALVGFDPHFTLSFAADGTPVAGQTSTLSATFNAIAPDAVWREQIMRAFQTWAVHTNADIGVVADGGHAFGSPGATQRDDRFGDIRVGAIAASPEVGAVSVPVDNFVSGTWLADVLFNSQFDYQSADDILAVALHEAGNVFGLADSADPDSPLYTGGSPTVNDPTPADVAALQALFGTRLPDAHETIGTNTDNDSFATAAELALWDGLGGDGGTAPTIVYGDVGSASDVDYFYIDTPGDYFGPVTFKLRTAGISLLRPDVTIFDAAQQPLDHLAAEDIGGSVLTVQIPASTPHQRFYVRVAGAAADVFGVGGYSLVTQFDGINLIDATKIDEVAGGKYRFLSQEDLAKFFDANESELYNDDGHSDDTANVGTELTSLPGFVADSRYETTASIADSADVDFYSVKSPQLDGSALNVMTVAVRSLDPAGLIPKLTVLDENQQPLAAEVIVNGGGELVVQLTGIAPQVDYLVSVAAADSGGPFATGNYQLAVAFTATPATLEPMASGSVGDAVAGNIHTLYVGRAQLFHLVLEAGPSAAAVPSAVIATIRDANSAVVATIAAPPGERRSLAGVFLNAGTYTVEVVVRTLDGSLSPSVSYSLVGTSISDPFVGDPQDPNSHPFACTDPDLAGYFCYPGDFISPDPFLWDNFIGSLPSPPPPLDLGPLVDSLLGGWWSWVWAESGANGPPLARDDGFEASQGGGGGAAEVLPMGPASNVLANDIEPEGDPFVAVLQTPTAHGSVVLNPNGTFVYSPDHGFWGTDQFSYVASDFRQASAPATVRIVVTSGIAGDYNADGAVNNDDYLAWQASLGSVDELLPDGNRDGQVNAADYTIWRDKAPILVNPAPGDFNLDAVVNNDDYVLWAASFGQAVDLRADGNHDGRVDSADYTVWRDHLVTAGGRAAALVAEPATLGLSAVQVQPVTLATDLATVAADQPPVSHIVAPPMVADLPTAALPLVRTSHLGSLTNSQSPNAPAGTTALLFASPHRTRHVARAANEGACIETRLSVVDAAFANWPQMRRLSRSLPTNPVWRAMRWSM